MSLTSVLKMLLTESHIILHIQVAATNGDTAEVNDDWDDDEWWWWWCRSSWWLWKWWWYDNYIIESEFMYIIISFEIVYTTPDSMEKIFSVDILSTEGNTVINAMMYTVDIQI